MSKKAPVKQPLKLMLLEEIKGLGVLGDVVKVRPGFARNYLLPRGLATLPSADGERRVGGIRKRAAQKAQESMEQAKAAAAALSNVSVHIEVKAGEGGHLYGSVTEQMISDALAKSGYTVEPSGVRLENPIKELGIYDVPLKLHGDIEAKVKLYVVTPAPAKAEKKPEKKADKGDKAEKSDKKAEKKK